MDVQAQRQRILRRLVYYQRVNKIRLEEYDRFKHRFIIPRHKRALQKIDEKSYGICDVCGECIDEQRLASIPAATLCLFCQESYERTRKRSGHPTL